MPFASRAWLAAIGFTERYLLSALYIWLAWKQWPRVHEVIASWPPYAGIFNIQFVRFVQEGSLLLVPLLIGLLLLISSRPVQTPRRAVELWVPLAMSLFFLTYSLAPKLPAFLRTSPLAREGQIVSAVFGLVLGALGAVIALWGVISLGRSFGIFVAVREVVLHGPYQYVRHPIYLGYLFVWAGLVFVSQSAIVLLLVAIHTALLVYRARLEESRLCEASEEYREYTKTTGFLFPIVTLGGETGPSSTDD